ncbi:alcohol dehydrogenase catalytic domain-containing protein [Amycolatopsis sp. NPDC051106]|uniref:zinc-dependent alcohol dehydrogenase n=1 Tax=unclassified Amycolatopsis TaxID=2618356 RepID=UPI0034207AF0
MSTSSGAEPVRPALMRAAVWTGPGAVAVRDVERPLAKDGDVLVRVEYGGICGTDLAILAGAHPRAEAPLILGHEIVGTVERPSAGGGPPAGTRVAVEPLIACDRCRACRDGARHVCRNLELYGIDAPGGLAEFVAVPVDRVLPVAPRVEARLAAWAEPLAVAVHAVGRAEPAAGATVLVFGGGPIGILTALVARRNGAARVVVVEPKPARRATAERCGFEIAPACLDPVAWFRSTNDGEGADVVFDAAGHPAVAAVLPAAARETGSIVLVAVYKTPPPVDLRALCFAEQRIIGARVYSRRDFAEAVSLLAGDELGLDRLPVAVLPLESVAEAFELAQAADAPIKVLLRTAGAEDGPAKNLGVSAR